VSKHFTKRRSLALGIVTTGVSLGGFTFSALASKLLNTNLGFAWTVRVSAFIALGCILLANLLVTQPEKVFVEENEEPSSIEEAALAVDAEEKIENKRLDSNRKTVEDSQPRHISQLLRDPAYLAVISSAFLACLGLYFPM
jgi:MFS family permease